MEIKLIDRLSDIPKDAYTALWQQSCPEGYPFLRYEFLSALESSGSVASGPFERTQPDKTGWQVHHLVIQQDDALLAFMPMYLKWHSYGEYVFDWAWDRSGLNYYPKLINAIPFTPCQGPRVLLAEGMSMADVWPSIIDFLDGYCKTNQLSGWHSLFAPEKALESVDKPRRFGCQFHWFNENYESFDGFIASFSSRKRKQVNRERRQVRDLGICVKTSTSDQISSDQLHDFFVFYQMTYAKRSGHGGYLSGEFFQKLLNMADQLLLVEAFDQDRKVAASLYFYDKSTLFGRYWGCLEEFHSLHFEACYYQGIEFAINKQLAKFDAGAQGEHKLARGFQPVLTHSYHHIVEPGFRKAIDDFCRAEAEQVMAYRQDCLSALPFRQAD